MNPILHDRLPEILRMRSTGNLPGPGHTEWLMDEIVRMRKRLELVEPLIDRVLNCEGTMVGAVIPHDLMRELKAARDT